MNNNKIRSIVLEGGDGSGKTTILNAIAEYLSSKHINFIITREPGGIEIAEKIREIILDKSHTSMDAKTETLLYAAARRQHLVEKVFPALEQGTFVVFDRFVDSSLAYQGVGRNIGIDKVMQVNEFALDGFMPDLTIYLDVTPEVGLERINADKDREVNRLDLEDLSFHYRIKKGYHELVKRYPERFAVINADQTKEEVVNDVFNLLDVYLINTEL